MFSICQSAPGARRGLQPARTPEGPTKRVAEVLSATLEGAGLALATGGAVPGVDGFLIDHVAHSVDLGVESVRGWVRDGEDGRRLSDHDGVLVQYRDAGQRPLV